MTGPAISVNGVPALSCNIQVPNIGAWVADVDFDGSTTLSGRVELKIGAATLSGTVDPLFSGTFGQSRKIRIVAGAGAWPTALPSKHYHNDLGIKPSHILNDVAGAIGEKIVVADDSRLGADWIRLPGQASDTLRELGLSWWVDYAGTTQTGPHPTVDANDYDLLHFDARNKVAELAVDDITKVKIGSVLTGRLDAPLTVRALEVQVDKDKTRMIVWGGGENTADARIMRALRALIRTETGSTRYHGVYRYRVVSQLLDRFVLQAIGKKAPDLVPVKARPGMPGAKADLALGSEVLVMFEDDGDPQRPVIMAYADASDGGFKPTKSSIDAEDEINLGRADGTVIRVGDNITVGTATGAVVLNVGIHPPSKVKA